MTLYAEKRFSGFMSKNERVFIYLVMFYFGDSVFFLSSGNLKNVCFGQDVKRKNNFVYI